MEIKIDINRAMSLCLRNNIKVSPFIDGQRFGVEVVNVSNKIKGIKRFSKTQIANAVSKTYKYYAIQIIKDNAS